ncbi:uncharacterized protein LOC142350628 [Convolutriloba macropyga]|uniref:uncharacterized protein LOC142350628 n=1 Tax=Convolutriloba macropyga TaxID=536237 RepID=UPI003F51DE3D
MRIVALPLVLIVSLCPQNVRAKTNKTNVEKNNRTVAEKLGSSENSSSESVTTENPVNSSKISGSNSTIVASSNGTSLNSTEDVIGNATLPAGNITSISDTINKNNTTNNNTASKNSTDGGLQGNMILPELFTWFPYKGVFIDVYKHASLDLFYFMPVCLLMKDTATFWVNQLTKTPEMVFKVKMWSKEIKNATVELIKKENNNTYNNLTVGDVDVYPIEKLRITWREGSIPMIKRIRLLYDWQPYSTLKEDQQFSFVCEKKSDCKRLRNAMIKNPMMFDKLEVQIAFRARVSFRDRMINITTDDIRRTEIFYDMTNMLNVDGTVRFMQFKDMFIMAAEAVENKIIKYENMVGYEPGDRYSRRMLKLLLLAFETQKTSTANFTPKHWEKLYGKEEFSTAENATISSNFLTKQSKIEKRGTSQNGSAISRNETDSNNETLSLFSNTEQPDEDADDDIDTKLVEKVEKPKTLPSIVYRFDLETMENTSTILTIWTPLRHLKTIGVTIETIDENSNSSRQHIGVDYDDLDDDDVITKRSILRLEG